MGIWHAIGYWHLKTDWLLAFYLLLAFAIGIVQYVNLDTFNGPLILQTNARYINLPKGPFFT